MLLLMLMLMLILMLLIREALKIFTPILMCACMPPIFNISIITWSYCLYHHMFKAIPVDGSIIWPVSRPILSCQAP